jgi:hypothetical protein
MPDYYDGISGRKPSEKEQQAAAAKEHEKKQEVRREAAGRHAEAHKKAGPAERMYAQDRFINQSTQGNRNERSAPRAEPTPAQREMQAKREVARAEDRQQAKTAYSDKKYAELPKQHQGPSR